MALDANLRNTKTMENLMRAFAGESQARNRYTFAASQAKKQNLHVVETIFTFTANQEKEHAEIFYGFLKDLSGETIHIDGGYPVDISPDMEKLLRFAQHNENEEHDVVYKAFGDTAREEGFEKIARTFHWIAEIEKTHGERFGKYAQLIEDGRLFVSDVETGWVCLNCGFVYNGKQAPAKCPVCDHDQGYFIRMELGMVPFYQV